MVDEPVRLDSLRASGGDDLIEDVRDAGLEILRRLVLEIRDLLLSCARSSHGTRVRAAMLVVAATERELALLDGLDTFCCGIGPVDAALQTARVLEERRPDAVVQVGIAGSRTLEPPSLVLGSEAVYCDVIDPASTLPRIERARPDAALLERARAALPEAHVLPIATCGKVGGGTDFDVEAMEGFGVLRACELAGVPAVELRAISNSPDEADRTRWRFDDAFAALADALHRLDVV